jgi:hypothetical protein
MGETEMKSMRINWLRRVLALFALFAPLQLAALPGVAWAYGDAYNDGGTDGYGDFDFDSVPDDGEDGAGTRWRKCRAEAENDWYECVGPEPGVLRRLKCYLVWEADNIGCDVELFRALGLPLFK